MYERFTWSSWQMAALMNNFVGDGNGYFGNLALKPEQANKLSATFDWHAADGSWGFKATPVSGKTMSYTVANDRNHELITGFTLDRFRNFALTGEKGAASVGH